MLFSAVSVVSAMQDHWCGADDRSCGKIVRQDPRRARSLLQGRPSGRTRATSAGRPRLAASLIAWAGRLRISAPQASGRPSGRSRCPASTGCVYLCRGVPPMKLCRARGWALTEDVRWWGHPAATAPNPRNTQFGKVHRVTASVGLWAVAATHRPPQRMWRFGWRRRVPMLYGTRRGSRPALLPRVCGVTCEYGTKLWSLDGLEERGEGDSGLRAARPDDGRDNRSP